MKCRLLEFQPNFCFDGSEEGSADFVCVCVCMSNKFPSVGATVAAIDSTTKISQQKFGDVKVSLSHDPQFFPYKATKM